MNISDEKLGAFLDQELSAQDMNMIRDAVRNDATLAERLAMLSSADAMLKRHAAALDSRPMPDAVMAMLRSEEQTTDKRSDAGTNKVVQLSRWQSQRQRVSHWVSQHAALAAGIALVVGFTGGQFLDGSTGNRAGEPAAAMIVINMASNVTDALDTTLSGELLSINGETRLLSRFSFVDQQARHCRQFVLETGTSGNINASENIACRTEQGWQLVASAQAASANAGEYQTASGSAMLDSTLDAMMPGTALSLEEENALIGNQWQ